MTLGPIAFLAPWLLVALALLPVLWWLLRAAPPAPLRQAFPGVRLLLGLDDPETTPERTPWWLLLLRMLAVAAAILAFSAPVLNPRAAGSTGPLTVLLDGGWGDAPDWAERQARIAAALDDAARAGRPVALHAMSEPPPADGPSFRAAQDWAGRLATVAPRAWAPDREAWADWAEGQDAGFETLWLTDGLAHGGEERLARALLDRGPVTLVGPGETAVALTPPRLEAGELAVAAVRATGAGERPVAVTAVGPDPSGIERPLGTAGGVFAAGETETTLKLALPVELRNRVGRIALVEGRSAAGVALADDSVRRRKVGLMSGRAGDEAQELIDPLHYLRNALQPFAEVIEAPLPDMLRAAPDVLVMADVGNLGEAERQAVIDWVEKGGLLLRFAGPRLAASGAGQLEADPLLPVRLRAGGRSLGGAMSWGAPRRLQPFPEGSPFAGLALPEDVDVTTQVMAQPDPDLPDRVMASLEDGTPLVTGAALGEGRVVLVHVTANADWSNLPLSGLFVRMLERLTLSAGGGPLEPEALEGSIWQPLQVMNGFGDLGTPSMVAGVPGARLASERPAADMPPGIYASGERRAALNVLRAGDRIAPLPGLPAGVVVEALDGAQEVRLGPWLLGGALALFAVDVLATLALGGRRGGCAAGVGGGGPATGGGRTGRGRAARCGQRDGARLCADRRRPGGRGEPGGPAGAEPGAVLAHGDRTRRAGGGGSRDRRSRDLSLPLLARGRGPASALGRGLRPAERLHAARRDDPVRHPGRAARRRLDGQHAQRAAAAAHCASARRAAAGARASRPRADPDVLPAAGLSRPL